MIEHRLVVHARGAWERPPREVVGARCTCGQWNAAYTMAGLAREGADEAWPLALAVLEDDHQHHMRGVVFHREAAAGKDPSFY